MNDTRLDKLSMECIKNIDEIIQIALCFCGTFLFYFMLMAIYTKYRLSAIRKNIRICFNKTPGKKSINFLDSYDEV